MAKKAKRTRRISTQHSPTLAPSAEDRRVALTLYVPPPPQPRTRLEVVEAVCAHIINGDRVHEACHKEGITWKTLFFWKAEDNELGTLYARAREASAESWEDRSTEEVEQANIVTVQLARLREDNYRWRAKMANPKKFSDRPDDLGALEKIGLEALLAAAYRNRVGA